MHIGEHVKSLRTQSELTQSDLVKKMGLTYIQIGRYEGKKAVPFSDVLQKLSAALNTTTDFLMNSSSDQMASDQLTYKELLLQFREVQKLNPDDKHLIKTFIDAFLTKRQAQKLAS